MSQLVYGLARCVTYSVALLPSIRAWLLCRVKELDIDINPMSDLELPRDQLHLPTKFLTFSEIQHICSSLGIEADHRALYTLYGYASVTTIDALVIITRFNQGREQTQSADHPRPHAADSSNGCGEQVAEGMGVN